MNDDVIYLDHGGRARRYVLHRPPGFRPGGPAVLMLDGRGGTPWTAMKSSGWSAKADREGFLVLYPEALRLDPAGPQHFLTNPQMWNAGAGGSDTDRPDVDDVGFLRAVIADATERHGADPARIFMSGFSNGAAMSFRMAAEDSHRLAAIGVVAGPCRVRGVRMARRVPTIYFYGKLDPLGPFDGGEVALPWGVTEHRPPVREHVRAWRDAMGLADDPQLESRECVTIERYGDVFEFWTIEDLGHVWPGGHRLLPEKIVGASSERVRATEVIWDFFRRAAP